MNHKNDLKSYRKEMPNGRAKSDHRRIASKTQ